MNIFTEHLRNFFLMFRVKDWNSNSLILPDQPCGIFPAQGRVCHIFINFHKFSMAVAQKYCGPLSIYIHYIHINLRQTNFKPDRHAVVSRR